MGRLLATDLLSMKGTFKTWLKAERTKKAYMRMPKNDIELLLHQLMNLRKNINNCRTCICVFLHTFARFVYVLDN